MNRPEITMLGTAQVLWMLTALCLWLSVTTRRRWFLSLSFALAAAYGFFSAVVCFIVACAEGAL